MNLIPGETQKWKEALNTPLFQQDWEKYAALNDWSAAGGCRQDVECGFCFCCCWKLCQAQVTSNLSSLFCYKCRSLTSGTGVGNGKLNKEFNFRLNLYSLRKPDSLWAGGTISTAPFASKAITSEQRMGASLL